jgi:hypothetical protein
MERRMKGCFVRDEATHHKIPEIKRDRALFCPQTKISERNGANRAHNSFGAFFPLSTDLNLPALPGMALYFNVSADLANLTLILFFVF